MSSPQLIDLRSLAPTPWKNGAGLTREIAVEPAGASLDDFDWRISVAEIACDAPFSAFAGVDRCIVLLHGAGMRLRSLDDAIDAVLDAPLQPYYFAGDAAVGASLIAGACSDFNVMVRKARSRADVLAVSASRDLVAADAALIFCVRGEAFVEAAQHAPLDMREGQAALWRTAAPARTLRVQTVDTHLLIVQIHAVKPASCQDAIA